MMRKIVIKGGVIYTPQQILHNHAIIISGGKITNISPLPVSIDNAEIIELTEKQLLIPGIIDLFVHGAQGKDVMDATQTALETISKSLPQEGVTSFLAATMTQPYERIEQAMSNARSFMANQNKDGARMLGVYLEGPFLSAENPGVQDINFMVDPDIDKFKLWQKLSGGHIKIATIAPEKNDADQFIEYLKQQDIIASIAHTNASYQQAVDGIISGCSHATHLFNAMSGIHHRKAGAALAALLDDRVTVELIVDGLHLSPEIIQLVLKVKPRDKVVLASDAMRAKYLEDGCYELGGQQVEVLGDRAQLKNGTLAGSVLKMNQAIKNMCTFVDCSIADAITYACENPAKHLNIFHSKGSIEVGKDADLTVISNEFEIDLTIREGHLLYQRF